MLQLAYVQSLIKFYIWLFFTFHFLGYFNNKETIRSLHKRKVIFTSLLCCNALCHNETEQPFSLSKKNAYRKSVCVSLQEIPLITLWYL